ncbi:MAG TPA: hypothetical protein PLF91_15300, partial [Mycolicibacterium fallax]|nr:hypothetical protein [Mycolicibacterium fallax]
EVHNWPLWARIEVRQGGSLVETVYTSPWNGYYEIPALPNGLTYDFTFTFDKGGDVTVAVPISAGNAPRQP